VNKYEYLNEDKEVIAKLENSKLFSQEDIQLYDNRIKILIENNGKKN
jgi:hypothetical protein